MTWRVPLTVAVVEDDSVTWVLPFERGQIVRLDAVSTLIWRAADGTRDADAVVARLVDENDWEPEAIRLHVASFIAELTACGLLEKETA